MESVQGVSRVEDVRAAGGQLDSAKGKYEAAQAQLSYAEIRSPISGVVADRPGFPGEMANAGSPLLTVMDISSVIARVNIPQAEAARVKVGQPARIVSADSAVEADGKVTVVSPALDPQSTTVEIWVQAANPGEKLKPGGAVRVSIMAGHGERRRRDTAGIAAACGRGRHGRDAGGRGFGRAREEGRGRHPECRTRSRFWRESHPATRW